MLNKFQLFQKNIEKLPRPKIRHFFIPGFFIVVFIFIFSITPPPNFPTNTVLEIERGSNVKRVASLLKEQNIIRSSTLFSLFVQFSDKRIIQSGKYYFDEPQNLIDITRRLKRGDFNREFFNINFFEGMTVREMAERLESFNFRDFDPDRFIELALPYEGFLFPDTYRFSDLFTEEIIINMMRENFNNRISPLLDEIEESGRTLEDIIIMASIVEKEATSDTFQNIADILWHRININMPLQVDATFVYSIGKNSFNVTLEQMRDVSNPFNTYVHLGLPPTPIANPGLNSIRATINTNPTPYLFFLTGRDGNMYYAIDFETHIQNRRRYLD